MTMTRNTEISVAHPHRILPESAEMEGGKVLELDLHAKKLKTLKDLSKLKYLRVLDASCNEISKIQGLSGNKELRELKLYGNCVEGLDGVEKLTELHHLLLHFNKISSIGKGLRNCHKLQFLRLDHNLLEVVSRGDLAPCSAALTHLDLSHNQIHTVEGLDSLGSLVEVNLANNCLKEVPSLTRCKKLTELNLSSNPIDVKGSKIPLQLKTLKLASISLPSLSHLPKLPHLQDLHIPHNSLTSMEDCQNLSPSLEFLDVKGNLLKTVQALAPLGKLVELMELEVEGNTFCSKSSNYRADVSRVLPKIETLDGVSLVTGVAVETSRPLMRPMTPSTVGPSLRQVERELLEAEIQLQNYSSGIAARFELLRTADEESGRANEISRTDDRGLGEHCDQRPSDASWTDNHISGRDKICDGRTDIQSSSRSTDGVDHDTGCETDINKRPPTRSGSRARLQEALIYASEKYNCPSVQHS